MDDRPVMRTEGGGGVRSACCVNSASGVRVLMPGEFGWGGRDSVLTVERVGPEGGRPFFLGTSSPMMVAAEGGAADAVCLQVGSHRFSRCYGDRVHALVGQ